MSTINNNDINTQHVGGLGPNQGASSQTSNQATDAEKQAAQAALKETANKLSAEIQGDVIATEFLGEANGAATETLSFGAEANYPTNYSQPFYFNNKFTDLNPAQTAARSDYISGNKLYSVFFEGSDIDGFKEFSYEEDEDGNPIATFVFGNVNDLQKLTLRKNDEGNFVVEDATGEPVAVDDVQEFVDQMNEILNTHSFTDPEIGQTKSYSQGVKSYEVTNNNGMIVTKEDGQAIKAKKSENGTDYSFEKGEEDNTWVYTAVDESGEEYTTYVKVELDDDGNIIDYKFRRVADGEDSGYLENPTTVLAEEHENMIAQFREVMGLVDLSQGAPNDSATNTYNADGQIDSSWENADGEIYKLTSSYSNTSNPTTKGIAAYSWEQDSEGQIQELITLDGNDGQIEIITNGNQKTFTLTTNENGVPKISEITNSETQADYVLKAAELYRDHSETNPGPGETENFTQDGTAVTVSNTGDYTNTIKRASSGNNQVVRVSSLSEDGSRETIFVNNNDADRGLIDISKQADGSYHARKYTLNTDGEIFKVETTENYQEGTTDWNPAPISMLTEAKISAVKAEVDRLKEIGGIGEDLPPPKTDTYTAEGHIDKVNYDAEGNITSYESDYSGQDGDLELSSGVKKYTKTINEDGSTTETLVFDNDDIGTITIDRPLSGAATITQTVGNEEPKTPEYASNYIDHADTLFDQHSATDPVNGERETYTVNGKHVVKEQTGVLINSYEFSSTEGTDLNRVSSEYSNGQIGGSFLVFGDDGESTYYTYSPGENGNIKGLRIEYDAEGEIESAASISDFDLDTDLADQLWLSQSAEVVLAGNEDLYAGDYEKLMGLAEEARSERNLELIEKNADDSYTANGRSDFVTRNSDGEVATLFSDLGPFSSEYNTYALEYTNDGQPKHTLTTDDYTFVITEGDELSLTVTDKSGNDVEAGIFDKNQILKEAQELRGSNHFNQLKAGESFEYTETINGVDIVTNRSKDGTKETMYRSLPNGGNIFEYEETQDDTTSNLKIMGNGQQLLTITNDEGEFQFTRDGAHGGITSAKFKAAGLDSYTDNALVTNDHRETFDSLYKSLTEKNVDMSTTSNLSKDRKDSQVRYGNYAYVLKSELGDRSGFNFGTQNISEYSYEQINRNNSVESFKAGNEQYLVYKTNGEIQSIQKKTGSGYTEYQSASPEAQFGFLDELRATHSYNTFVDGEITTNNAQGGTSTISQAGNVITTESTDNNGARTSISQQFLTGPLQSLTKITGGSLKDYYIDQRDTSKIPNVNEVHSVEKIILSEGLEMIVYKDVNGEVLDQIFTNGDKYPNHPNATAIYDMAEPLIQPMETNIRVGGDSRFAGTIDLTTAVHKTGHQALPKYSGFNYSDWDTVSLTMSDGSTLMMGSRANGAQKFIELSNSNGNKEFYGMYEGGNKIQRWVNGEVVGTQHFVQEELNGFFNNYNSIPQENRHQWVHILPGEEQDVYMERVHINAGNYRDIFNNFNLDNFVTSSGFANYADSLNVNLNSDEN